jgi:uncharacterized Zn-binding protein involved in type VI secretion
LSQPVCRLGDINSGGGAVRNGINRVLVNNLPVAVKDQSIVSGHDLHMPSPIVEGDNTVLIENRPIAFVTCLSACGHQMIEGSRNVIVGGNIRHVRIDKNNNPYVIKPPPPPPSPVRSTVPPNPFSMYATTPAKRTYY